jgi:RNA recognition motif-containing protein
MMPPLSDKALPDGPYYAFVDFSTAEEAQRAVRERDGALLNNDKIKVRVSERVNPSWKVYERAMIHIKEDAEFRASSAG